MSNLIVGNTAALSDALHSAQSGDTILLQPGTYTGLDYVFNNLTFAQGITITSADSANQATLTHFTMSNSSGITFSKLALVTQAKGYFDFEVYYSSNIRFDHVSVHGSLDGNPQNDIEGIRFEGSNNISITNSEFQQLVRAVAVGSSNNINISNNNIHDVEASGLVFAQVGNVTINGNIISNFHTAVGDHPDAIQFLTSGTTVASHDITITNNAIYRGAGDATQGIFLRDQLTTLNYQNVTIANNLIDGTGYGGIAVDYARNISVTGNTLVSLVGPTNTTPLQVFNSNGVTITNNQAISIGADGDTGLTLSGNTINAAVTDGGVAALNAWLAAHPNVGIQDTTGGQSIVTRPSAANLLLTGTGANDTLTGGAGNDTLDGQGGYDVLSGGAGNDTYILQNGSARITELKGGGIDTVIVKGTFTLPANVENLVISSAAANGWAGYGNELNNQITGNAGDNYLDGAAGDDTISGGAGNDTLFGGLGDDRLTGGSGNDTFRFAPGGGHDTITDFGNGSDKIDILAYQKAGLTASLRDSGADVVISYSNGDSITVLGHHIADLKFWAYGWAI